MTLATLILAAPALILAGGLAVALVRQQDRHNTHTVTLLEAFRAERAQLINKIAHPHIQLPADTGPPVRARERDPQRAKDYARVGTVAPPGKPAENNTDSPE